jgi:hypothetical protein
MGRAPGLAIPKGQLTYLFGVSPQPDFPLDGRLGGWIMVI